MKGNEKGEGTRKGNSALVVGDISLCQRDPEPRPKTKRISCILGFTKHFWLIDNLRFLQLCDTTFVGWSYQLKGGDFLPCLNLETVCLHPPLWKALLLSSWRIPRQPPIQPSLFAFSRTVTTFQCLKTSPKRDTGVVYTVHYTENRPQSPVGLSDVSVLVQWQWHCNAIASCIQCHVCVICTHTHFLRAV